jgi:multimeric flavodoxin WrbA
MKLAIFNGSPRGESGNTRILLEEFTKGFTTTPGNSCEEYYLKKTAEHSRYAEIFQESEAVLLAFPLYTDAMPGLVKAFIERLRLEQNSSKALDQKKTIIFLVQSGFPEAVHCETVAKYLKKLARRLGRECGGVIIKGGVEGIQAMPPQMTQKLYRQFYALGENFGKTGELDEASLRKLRGMNRLPVYMIPVLYVMKWLGLMDFYWNKKLKENGAFKRRFDRPYSAN